MSNRLTPEYNWVFQPVPKHKNGRESGRSGHHTSLTYLLQYHIPQLILVHRLALEVEVEVEAWGNHGVRGDVDLTAVEGGGTMGGREGGVEGGRARGSSAGMACLCTFVRACDES